MHIYFSGLGGVGIGPLAEIAQTAGYDVSGSDASDSLMTQKLRDKGIAVAIGQDGSHIAEVHGAHPIDWFVYTAALPDNHPELAFAREAGIRTSKRDKLLAEIIRAKDLKLIAVSGTHGKTTTTGMFVWAFRQLGIPVSYSVGTTLNFGPSGAYDPESQYFVYECDEYDRNMLHFEPFVSVITSLDHDHIDTYPNEDAYRQAFVEFLEQSGKAYLWERELRYLQADPQTDLEAYDELMNLSHLTLAGDHVRHNAYLVERVMRALLPDVFHGQIIDAINSFPGTQRRMEKLADNLYTDYGHHPAEIAATLQMARELNDHVVLVYQPHQNTRQHDVRDEYKDSIVLAEKIYWLPTYLTREDESLEVLTPEQLIEGLSNKESAQPAELDDRLWSAIQTEREAGKLVLCMGAGTIDAWLRGKLEKL